MGPRTDVDVVVACACLRRPLVQHDDRAARDAPDVYEKSSRD
jgi:hypothetical protein